MDTLLTTLHNATEPSLRKQAESQLEQWETSSGFFQSLLDIFNTTHLDFKIRHLAIIYLKNGIDKYWRKTCKNAISIPEKNHIRSRLFLIQESNQQLSNQQAVVVSKIARHDFPNEWPDLLNQIMSQIHTAFEQNSQLKQASLYILHLVIKTLCSKLLARSALESMTPQIFQFLLQIFNHQCQFYMHHSGIFFIIYM
jgi:hypothetical protein